MITRAGDEHALFREECRRQMQRPLELREHYGFVSIARQVLDDAPFRSFDSAAEYRQWCDDNLPCYLGYKLVHS